MRFNPPRQPHAYHKTSKLLKVAISLTEKSPLPYYIGLTCFILSQLQLLSVTLNTVYLHSYNVNTSQYSVMNTIIRFTILDGWLNGVSSAVCIVLTTIIFMYMIMNVLIIITLAVQSFKNNPIKPQMLRYWTYISSAHPLVIFLPIHLASIRFIQISIRSDFQPIVRYYLLVISILSIVLNCVLTFSMLFVFVSQAKTQDVLSSKTYHNLCLIHHSFLPVSTELLT